MSAVVTSVRDISPGRAIALPLAFVGALLSVLFVPWFGSSLHIVVSFLLAASGLIAWAAWLWAKTRRGDRTLTFRIGIFKNHWVQALTQVPIYAYWGWYFSLVYPWLPLVFAQLFFANGVPFEAASLLQEGLESGALERRPGTLSGGEKQRVALARAWLSRPRLLLMDEPLAALDAPRKDEIFPYLERLRDVVQVPIVYVSHNLAEVARLADDLVVMQRGQVVLSGKAEAVLSDPKALPLVGVREAGAILPARVAEHGADGLSRLVLSGGELVLPGVTAPEGSMIRLRVLAGDVLLATMCSWRGSRRGRRRTWGLHRVRPVLRS